MCVCCCALQRIEQILDRIDQLHLDFAKRVAVRSMLDARTNSLRLLRALADAYP